MSRGELAPEDVPTEESRNWKSSPPPSGPNSSPKWRGAAVEHWIEDDLGFDNPHTFNNWRKHIRSLFDAFKKEIPYNPIEDVDKRDDATEHVGILTPEDTAKLFHYTHQNPPGDLGPPGSRSVRRASVPGSAFRLEKADINFADRGINLPKHKIKTGRRHYIDGLPDNLWLWLAETNDACWTLTPAEYLHLKSRVFIDSGCPHPRNCLRHSFCTYHVAAFQAIPGLTRHAPHAPEPANALAAVQRPRDPRGREAFLVYQAAIGSFDRWESRNRSIAQINAEFLELSARDPSGPAERLDLSAPDFATHRLRVVSNKERELLGP